MKVYIAHANESDKPYGLFDSREKAVDYVYENTGVKTSRHFVNSPPEKIKDYISRKNVTEYEVK